MTMEDEESRVKVQVFFKADGQITLSLLEALARQVLDGQVTDLADVIDASGSSWDDVLNAAEWEMDDAFGVEDVPEGKGQEQVPFVPTEEG